MSFDFINTLSESRLYPSTSSLRQKTPRQVADLAHAMLCALRILLAENETRPWAREYARKTAQYYGFNSWRPGGTDLYILLYALLGDADLKPGKDDPRPWLPIDEKMLIRWFKTAGQDRDDESLVRRIFLKLDMMFDIKDGSLKAIRRLVMDWPHLRHSEKSLAVTRLLQIIRNRASMGEMLPHLKMLAKEQNLEIANAYDPDTGKRGSGEKKNSTLKKLAVAAAGAVAGYMIGKKMFGENASAGATSAANIATSTGSIPASGSLGVGFDPNGHWGIYQDKKPGNKTKKKAATVIKR